MNLAVIGLQFGDEGKGKIVDYLAGNFDIIARFSGGSNAGHTVFHNGERFKLHLLPSGVLRGKIGILGNGMAVDMEILDAEIESLRERGIELRIYISSRAHVVTSFHKEMDEREDEVRKIGTTRRGIGPTYESKVKRVGVRVGELLDPGILERRLSLLTKMWGMYDEGRIREEVEKLHSLAMKYKESIVDTEIWLHREMESGKSILFEGSQAALLDVDFGTYPYVTSSSTIPGGISPGLGIDPRKIHRIVGVMKPYMTRVGDGPFPTEIFGEDARKLREKGGEYGATTGRPRRIGYLDMPLLRYASIVSGVDEIALTKVDVLEGMDRIPVAWEYSCDGKITKYPPLDIGNCEPIYRYYDGWNSLKDDNLKAFISIIEREIGARVSIVSYGAERESTIAWTR